MVKTSETNLRQWKKQYAGQIKITKSTELTQACKKDLLDGIELYNR